MSAPGQYIIIYDSPFRFLNPFEPLSEFSQEENSITKDEAGTSGPGRSSFQQSREELKERALDSPSLRPIITQLDTFAGSNSNASSSSVAVTTCVKSHQYFYSIIPHALGKKGGMQTLRKKKYSQLRKELREKNKNYQKLKAMKKIMRSKLSLSLKSESKTRMTNKIVDGLSGGLPFSGLGFYVFDDSLSEQVEKIGKIYARLRSTVVAESREKKPLTRERIEVLVSSESEAFEVFAKAEAKLMEDQLIFLLKEHKKHTFERFVVLPRLYDAFNLSLNHVSTLLENRKTGMGNKVKKIVLELLINSTPNSNMKLMRGRANIFGVGVTEKSVNKKYRQKNVMGREKQGEDSMEEREEVVESMNYCFPSQKEEVKLIENFQRSHTLPFPGLFCWTHGAIKESMKRYSMGVSEDYVPVVTINSETIEEINDSEKEPKEISEIFSEELIKLSEEEECSDEELAFKSILLLKELYLRMFSETEFLPDFINSEMDSLSEWGGKQTKGDYKTSLANALCFNIHTNYGAEGLLGSYVRTTTNQALKLAREKVKKEAPLIDQFKLLCIFQVMQSMLVMPTKEGKGIERLKKSVKKTFGSF